MKPRWCDGANQFIGSGSVSRCTSRLLRLLEDTEEHGSLRARLLSLLEDAWINDANNDQTGDDQSESDEGHEEDAASAGGEFTAYDPVLGLYISMRTV